MLLLLCVVFNDIPDGCSGIAHAYSDGLDGYFVNLSDGVMRTRELESPYICNRSWSMEASNVTREVRDAGGIVVCVVVGGLVTVVILSSVPFLMFIANAASRIMKGTLEIQDELADVHDGVDVLQTGQDEIFEQLLNVAKTSVNSSLGVDAMLDITGAKAYDPSNYNKSISINEIREIQQNKERKKVEEYNKIDSIQRSWNEKRRKTQDEIDRRIKQKEDALRRRELDVIEDEYRRGRNWCIGFVVYVVVCVVICWPSSTLMVDRIFKSYGWINFMKNETVNLCEAVDTRYSAYTMEEVVNGEARDVMVRRSMKSDVVDMSNSFYTNSRNVMRATEDGGAYIETKCSATSISMKNGWTWKVSNAYDIKCENHRTLELTMIGKGSFIECIRYNDFNTINTMKEDIEKYTDPSGKGVPELVKSNTSLWSRFVGFGYSDQTLQKDMKDKGYIKEVCPDGKYLYSFRRLWWYVRKSDENWRKCTHKSNKVNITRTKDGVSEEIPVREHRVESKLGLSKNYFFLKNSDYTVSNPAMMKDLDGQHSNIFFIHKWSNWAQPGSAYNIFWDHPYRWPGEQNILLKLARLEFDITDVSLDKITNIPIDDYSGDCTLMLWVDNVTSLPEWRDYCRVVNITKAGGLMRVKNVNGSKCMLPVMSMDKAMEVEIPEVGELTMSAFEKVRCVVGENGLHENCMYNKEWMDVIPVDCEEFDIVGNTFIGTLLGMVGLGGVYKDAISLWAEMSFVVKVAVVASVVGGIAYIVIKHKKKKDKVKGYEEIKDNKEEV